MAASRQDIERWFDEGVKKGATHLIVVCDTFDHSDYPVFVADTEDVRLKVKTYSGANMQRVMEVYDLKKDKSAQLAETRAYNF